MTDASGDYTLALPAGFFQLVSNPVSLDVVEPDGGVCDSGHGVCGTARLSPRSLVATGLFMAGGMGALLLSYVLTGPQS